MDIEKVDWQ